MDSGAFEVDAGVVGAGVGADCADTACGDDEDADEAVTLGADADDCAGAG